jgi:thiol:disulfide interchange protein
MTYAPCGSGKKFKRCQWGVVGNGALSCFIVEACTTAIFAAILIY